jgi:diguanylate cyclase (GGDEF)-like protein
MLGQLEKRKGAACVVIIDLDHFKRINDTHGHAMGDEALRRMVAACQRYLRDADLFGRLGGEEFGILLADCPREQGRLIAGRIRGAIEDLVVEQGGLAVTITASMGLASTDSSGHELRRLCADADAALYLAKDRGRNCVMADAGGERLAAEA